MTHAITAEDTVRAIIAATDADALGTVIDGPSGVRAWCPPEHRPKFVKSLFMATPDRGLARHGARGRARSL